MAITEGTLEIVVPMANRSELGKQRVLGSLRWRCESTLLRSMLGTRLVRGVLKIGVRPGISNVDLRDCDNCAREERGLNSVARALRNTVCGTTPSLGSSTSPAVLRLFSASGSKLEQDAKLIKGSQITNFKSRIKLTCLEIAFASLRM